uniref:FHA domain-containing protein n=1 Tax=Phytophthora ramorum TaxID=164328 RepID=H3HCS4_PHYRM
MIDVQGFLLRDCHASSKRLVEQANMRAEELRRELKAGKKALLDALEAEKENLDKDGNAIPRAFTIAVQCITGPYRGRKFSMDIDVKRHSSCFVGRSTGRKFRPPRGLSMPKDSELSTSHGEIKMETTGKIFFIDLDSTNGTRIDGLELDAHQPYELTLGETIKVEIGAGEYELTFEQKS